MRECLMNVKSAVAGLLFCLLAMPAFAGGDGEQDCPNCPPPRHYDSQEVVKTTRDVDHSQVINTTTVVKVPPRERDVNHLIVHENETRHAGTLLHKNLIIEKEIRYRHRPVRPVQGYRPPQGYRPSQAYAVLNPETGAPMWLVYPAAGVAYAVPQPQSSGCGCHWWER